MALMIRVYTVAVAAAVAALATTHMVWPVIEPTRSPLFLAAIVVSAWYGGLGPGLVATAVTVLAKMYVIMPPTGSFRVDDGATIAYLVMFVLVALLVSVLTGALRGADAANRALIIQESAARSEAEAANRAKDVFFAKMSHELRTPLQATASWARLLGRARHDDDLFDKAPAGLHRGIAAQSHLVDDLLAASTIIGDKMSLDLERVMLGPVIEAAVETAKAAGALPQPRVHVALDPSVGPVLGDRTQLEQIVCNLLSNALKFTPADGRVDIRLEHDGAHARIVVADTGRGIPAHVLPRLFDEFWQAGRADSGSPLGLGLGLAIVRQLAEIHGGAVHGHSRGPGCGATFVVELPLARGHTDRGEVARHGPPRRAAPDAVARADHRAAGRRPS